MPPRNVELLLGVGLGQEIMNVTEPEVYNEWLKVHGPGLSINLTNCSMEREMSKVSIS